MARQVAVEHHSKKHFLTPGVFGVILVFLVIFSFAPRVYAQSVTPVLPGVSAAVSGAQLLLDLGGGAVGDGLANILTEILKFFVVLLMQFALWVLWLSGSLFDLFTTWTIIDYKGTLDTFGLTTAGGPINLVWAFLRDIGNIIIIGMFVFVAIATILGIEKYGYKKLIVNLLLVAVFINFSLFFTKFTIDVSNFVAREIYAQIVNYGFGGSDPSGSSADTTGIASSFAAKLGVGSLLSPDTVRAKNNALDIFLLGVGSSIFIFVFAGVLLYGVFLIASRGIILIYLLITSSGAFATLLVPKEIRAGMWDKWKESLINATVFAPTIMLGLLLTVVIINTASSVTGSGVDAGLSTILISSEDASAATVASTAQTSQNVSQVGTAGQNSLLAAAANTQATPQQQAAATANALATGSGMNALWVFILGTAMLFITMKIANDMAKKVAGFNYAAAAPALGFLAGAGVAGIAGRQIIGRGATRFAAKMEKSAQDLEGKDKFFRAGIARTFSGIGASVGKKDFNVAKTGAGKAFTGMAGGAKGPIGGFVDRAEKAGKGGFGEYEKKLTDNLTKQAEQFAPTKEQKDKVYAEAMAAADPALKAEFENRTQIKAKVTARKEALASQQSTELTAQKTTVKAAADAANAAPWDIAARATLEREVAAQRALEQRHKADAERISQEEIRATTEQKEIEKQIVPKTALETAEETAASMAHRRVRNLPGRTLSGTLAKFGVRQAPSAERDEVAKKVRKNFEKSKKKKQEKDRAEAYFGTPPTPPTSPASPASTPPAGTP